MRLFLLAFFLVFAVPVMAHAQDVIEATLLPASPGNTGNSAHAFGAEVVFDTATVEAMGLGDKQNRKKLTRQFISASGKVMAASYLKDSEFPLKLYIAYMHKPASDQVTHAGRVFSIVFK